MADKDHFVGPRNFTTTRDQDQKLRGHLRNKPKEENLETKQGKMREKTEKAPEQSLEDRKIKAYGLRCAATNALLDLDKVLASGYIIQLKS